MKFSTNKLYMWRCVVAMAHADDLMHENEQAYLLRMFSNMKARAGLTGEQENILRDDVDNPKDIAKLLPHIVDPVYRSQVIYFARLLAYKDGVLQGEEEVLLEKLHAYIMDGVDINAVRAEVRQHVAAEMLEHEIETDSGRPKSGIARLLDRLALQFGIDLMD